MRALMRHVRRVIEVIIEVFTLNRLYPNVALIGLLPNFGGRVGGIEFNADYTRIYVASDTTPSYLYQCEMADAGNINSMTYTSRLACPFAGNLVVCRSKLTNKFYLGRGTIREYSLTNPNDISTAVYTGKQVILTTNAVFGIFFNDDESKLFTWEHITYLIKEYVLTIPGDISTAVYSGNHIVSSLYSRGITVTDNGKTILFWLQTGVKELSIIRLANAWDLSSYTLEYSTSDVQIWGEEIEIIEPHRKIITSLTTNLIQYAY